MILQHHHKWALETRPADLSFTSVGALSWETPWASTHSPPRPLKIASAASDVPNFLYSTCSAVLI